MVDPVVADLLAFIEASPSPYHAVAEAARRLSAANFVERDETAAWLGPVDGAGPSGPGFVRRGASLVAWGATDGLGDGAGGFRVVGAHTDSPNLRIKPRPDSASLGWQQLGVEIYGGVLLNSWLDRDLGLSGRVGVRSASGHEVRLMRDDRALLRVPQLAIHLDRDVNLGLKLNPQQHLTPIWGAGDPSPGGFAAYLADQLGVAADAVLSWDVMAHDRAAPTVAGRNDELISSARIDNQLSCWAAVDALVSVVARGDQVHRVGRGRVRRRWWCCSTMRRSAASRPRVRTATCWPACSSGWCWPAGATGWPGCGPWPAPGRCRATAPTPPIPTIRNDTMPTTWWW